MKPGRPSCLRAFAVRLGPNPPRRREEARRLAERYAIVRNMSNDAPGGVGMILNPAALGLLALSFALSLHAGGIPALPKPPIDSFAPPMREQIRRAYEEALKNPQLAGSNGRLGMLLYAYEQFESAEACFERGLAFD